MLSVPRGSSLDAVSFLERGQVDFAPLSISAGLREPREELPEAYLLLVVEHLDGDAEPVGLGQ